MADTGTDLARRRRGVFVDRDGTLIRDVGYLEHSDKLEILDGVPEAIQLLQRHGLKVVVITNQSGVGRGLLTEEALKHIHSELATRLSERGARLDGIYYCPHHPTEGIGRYRASCDCRKPRPGMVVQAAVELGLEPSRSFVVGDKLADIEVALHVGAKGILIEESGHEHGPDASPFAGQTFAFKARNLWEAARWIVHSSIVGE